MSIGDFPESLSQAILVGIMLVGRLGACHNFKWMRALSGAEVGQDSSNGVAVETGCSDLYAVIHWFVM